MTQGLSRTGDGKLLMLPSYVAQLPNGQESGSVWAVDLGGTNFRVMHVRLSSEPGKVRFFCCRHDGALVK